MKKNNNKEIKCARTPLLFKNTLQNETGNKSGHFFPVKMMLRQLALFSSFTVASTPVLADCVYQGVGSNKYICSDKTTVEQDLQAATQSKGKLEVITEPGFEAHVTTGAAIKISNKDNILSGGSVTYSDPHKAPLKSETGTALDIEAREIMIDTRGPIEGVIGISAINPYSDLQGFTGDIVINTGAVTGKEQGIFAYNAGPGKTIINTYGDINGEDRGIAAFSDLGDLTINTNANVFSKNASGIEAYNTGSGVININTNGAVGGAQSAINVVSNGAININLRGETANITKRSADVALSVAGGSTIVTNRGQLIGTVQFLRTENQLINEGTWNTAGGSNKFSWDEISSASLDNQGIIFTANDSKMAEITAFTNLGTFVNSGTLTMSDGGAGDQTVITGKYIGQPGHIILDTVLGQDASATDILRLQGGHSGQSTLTINNIGGQGGQTHQGIQVVEVSNGESEGTFTLAQRVVAGPYEYELYQGSISDPQDGHWYLRSHEDIPPPNSKAGTVLPKYRPEVGAYLGNQIASLSMFMHTLHDRNERRDDNLAQLNNPHTPWVRIVTSRTNSEALEGKVKEKTNRSTIQIGHAIASWNKEGRGRWQVGIMGGAGYSKTDANAHNNNSDAYGKVRGYSFGVYGTWFADTIQDQGAYADTWLLYGRYRNHIKGDKLAQETYNSHSLTASIEAGYTIILNPEAARQWTLTPQAQFIYTDYDSKDLIEQNTTRISEGSDKHLRTRLGVRLSNQATEKHSLIPFVELNWLTAKGANKFTFGNTPIANDVPKNKAQLKAGLQGNINKNWQLWGHVSAEKGKSNYKGYEGSAGLKYSW
jgi:outer membrane autotransporter protein